MLSSAAKKKVLFYISAIFSIVVTVSTMDRILPTSRAISPNDKNDSEYFILIYIEDKRLYLYENNKCIQDYPIASGKPGWPSPIGQWKIVEKGVWGEEFGGYWLGLNVFWGKYGIHGTCQEDSIGRAVSHGCIRMFHNDVKELYDIVPIGTSVFINGGPYGFFGTGFRALIPGDRGADVLEVQKRLKEIGYFKGKVSGIYEDDLKNALYEFQKNKRLKVKYTITDEDYHAMGFREFE